MQWSRCFFVVVSCTAILGGSSLTYGQTNEAIAEELFNRANELSTARRFDQACPLLAESQKLDPRPSTLFALADCERENNRIATSVAHFKEYLLAYDSMKPDVRRRHDERAKTARAHVGSMQSQIPTLTLNYAGKVPDDLTILLDGARFSTGALALPLPIDPGEHVVISRVPGRQGVEQWLTIGVGEKKTFTLSNDAASGSTSSSPSAPAPLNRRKVAGIALLGFGAAGIALGGATGGLAVGQKGIVNEQCRNLDCNTQGLDAVKQGRLLGNISTIGFAAGGAIAATGAILLLTALKSTRAEGVTRVNASPLVGGAFLSVEGRFQ